MGVKVRYRVCCMMPGEQEGDRKVVIGSAISDKDKDK